MLVSVFMCNIRCKTQCPFLTAYFSGNKKDALICSFIRIRSNTFSAYFLLFLLDPLPPILSSARVAKDTFSIADVHIISFRLVIEQKRLNNNQDAKSLSLPTTALPSSLYLR